MVWICYQGALLEKWEPDLLPSAYFKAPWRCSEWSHTPGVGLVGVLRSGVECTQAGRGVLVWRAADRQIDVVLAPLRDDE